LLIQNIYAAGLLQQKLTLADIHACNATFALLTGA